MKEVVHGMAAEVRLPPAPGAAGDVHLGNAEQQSRPVESRCALTPAARVPPAAAAARASSSFGLAADGPELYTLHFQWKTARTDHGEGLGQHPG